MILSHLIHVFGTYTASFLMSVLEYPEYLEYFLQNEDIFAVTDLVLGLRL